jgi:type II secretory pathway component PulF
VRKFAYKAMDTTGKAVEGQLEAEAPSDVDRYFLEQDLTPLRVNEIKVDGVAAVFSALQYRFKTRLFENELIAFTRQFAAAYGAGIAVPRILSMLSKQMSHRPFREAVNHISDQISGGKGLTDSFGRFPEYFDPTYLAILSTGEVSGNLDTVMDYAAGLLEKKMIHKERIKSTLLYPKLVVGSIIFTVIAMLIFVIPQFQKLYERFGSELPLPTRILVEMSHLFQHYWWWVGVAAFVPGYQLVQRLKRNAKVMLWVHEKTLKVPIFGPLFTKVELTHFCTTFSLLMRSGIRVTDATEIAIRGMRNSYFRHRMSAIVPHLEQGGTVSGAMEKVDVVPPLMSSMVAVGEEAGALDSLLDRIAFLYENDTEMMLKRLPTMLEPIILSILFALTLGLAVAIYLPMWKLSSLVRGGG